MNYLPWPNMTPILYFEFSMYIQPHHLQLHNAANKPCIDASPIHHAPSSGNTFFYSRNLSLYELFTILYMLKFP